MYLLETHHLSIGHNNMPLMEEVNIKVEAGKIYGLQGESGIGKSSLFRVLAGLTDSLAGSITWEETSLQEIAMPWYRSQVMFLLPNLPQPDLPVQEYVQMPFRFQAHKDRSYSAEDFQKNLRAMRLDETLLAKNCQELSSGQWQVIRILQAIALAPKLLLLDEPTANLDSQRTLLLEDLLVRWCQANQAALCLTSHEEGQLARFASETWQIKDKQITRVSAFKASIASSPLPHHPSETADE